MHDASQKTDQSSEKPNQTTKPNDALTIISSFIIVIL